MGAVIYDRMNVVFDRATGETLYGWQAVRQDIGEGLRTLFGSRVMREYFGCLVPQALGRTINPETMIGLTASIAAFLDLFEPRFKVNRVSPSEVSRSGGLAIVIEGEYRPRALVGDLSTYSREAISIRLQASEIEVQ